jgi:transcriptional regulator with XRE-family HTH domain
MLRASVLLQRCRRGASLSQRALASLAGTPQSAIARAEAGRQDLTVTALDRLVHAAGWTLTVLPVNVGTAADAAESCARFIAASDVDGPYRSVIQLADDLASEHGAERVALTVTPPRPTGDRRYDAFIAGVVELRLDAEALPHPKWLADAESLSDRWFVDEWSIGVADVVDRTPPALRNRGVIVDASELESA